MTFFHGEQMWHVAGWTMLHFLWLGALVMIAALVCRLLLRRASAGVRYAAAVGSLALLAALPIGIGAWLVGQSPAAAVVHQIGQVSQVPQIVFGSPPARVATTEPVVGLSGNDERAALGSTPSAPGSARRSFGDEGRYAMPIPRPTRHPAEPAAGCPRGLSIVVALESVVPYLPWLWLVGTPITFALLATGLVGTKRLRGASRTIDDGPIADTCARLARALRIRGRVAAAVCERIAAPVLVGIVRPIILLPPSALVGWSPDEVEMVLLHELAHVRRWDNLVNLMQRIVESLLFFHPAVWLLSGWVRREREACCDAVVVAQTHEPHAYAEMLVAIAAQAQRGALDRGRGRPGSLGSLAAASAMAAGPLRSRIRHILQLEDDPMLVSGKSLAVVMSGILLAATLVVLNLPSRGDAEEPTTKITKNTKNTESTTAEQVEQSQPSSDDWPEGVTFPSPKAGEIAREAWRRLGLKLVPATAAELAHTRVKNGLRVVGGEHIPKDRVNIPEPLILVKADNKTAIEDFDDLDRVLRHLQDNPRPMVAIELHQRFYSGGSSVGGPLNLFAIYHAEPEKAGQLEQAVEDTTRKFPSLDQQKLADLAYNRLGLELEPIDQEDLKRVKAFGYEGGVKVTNSRQMGAYADDILVGLHVWPTTSLEDVAKVLRRDDLREMNPLKFYIVRPGRQPQGGITIEPREDTLVTGRIQVWLGEAQDGSARSDSTEPRPGAASSDELDVLRQHVKLLEARQQQLVSLYKSGDIDFGKVAFGAVDLALNRGELAEVEGDRDEARKHFDEARAHAQEAVAVLTKMYQEGRVTRDVVLDAEGKLSEIKQKIIRQQGPAGGAGTDVDKSSLRYEGRSFDEWRDAWQSELSPERRTEAVKALAAFGASGYGKQAAKAILEIARQYDWIGGSGNSLVEKLKAQMINAFVASNYPRADEAIRIPVNDWLPILVEQVRSGHQRIRDFAQFVLPDVSDASLVPRLIELSHDDGLKSIRGALLEGLGRIYRGVPLGAGLDFRTPEPQIAQPIVKRLTEALGSTDAGLVQVALCSLYGDYVYRVLQDSGAQQPVDESGQPMSYFGLPQESQFRYRPELLGILAHGSPENRLGVVRVLGNLGPKAKPAVPHLLPLVLDQNQDFSRAAIFAVREITGSYQVAVAYLNDVVKKVEDAETVDRAQEMLKAIEGAIDWERQHEQDHGLGQEPRGAAHRMGPYQYWIERFDDGTTPDQ